ncbi:AAA family ATPase [Rossellomorea vietnamensis]|uniref:AAA family ATPase n=1 Tax=Rossellomorea vietnamensis TaxID=218284 RepID=UPI001CCDB9FE|nr:P-loop NTPase [Rossellomorea vietnamensis]MCA0150479.1 AAA family ATPase [Rossellomorea vietnamensis]
MINWFYYSDTNTAPGDLELLLQKQSYELHQFPQWEDLIYRIKETDHSILFLKANAIYDGFNLCQEISIMFPHLYIILIVPDHLDHTRKAMNVGASNILRYSSEQGEKKEVIDQAVKYLKLRERGVNFHLSKNCKVLSVCSPKGGIGRTTTAVNLAVTYAQMGKKVGMLDANLQFGDLNMHLDIRPNGTLYEWVKEEYEQHSFSLDKYLFEHNSGVSILPAPLRPEFFEMITETHIEKVIEEMKMRFDILVIDVPSYLSEVHLKCLERSEECLLLVTNDLPVLKRSKLYMEALNSFQFSEKIKIIHMKDKKNKQVDPSKMERILETTVFGTLPTQEMVSQSVHLGVPVVLSHPRKPIGKSFLTLAKKLSEPAPQLKQEVPPKTKKGVKHLVPMKGRV